MTRSVLILAVALAILIAAPAVASVPQVAYPSEKLRMNTPTAQYVQRQISAQEAKAIALSRVPGGEVVDIRRMTDAYRVRIIARDGRVIDIIVDVATGRIR